MSVSDFLMKVAEDAEARGETLPEVEPPHPYMTAIKQLGQIGAGTALGYGAGRYIPELVDQYILHKQRSPGFYKTVGGISAVATGLGTLGASMLQQARQAEADRANQEYKDFHARRYRDSANPSVQPPSVRS